MDLEIYRPPQNAPTSQSKTQKTNMYPPAIFNFHKTQPKNTKP